MAIYFLGQYETRQYMDDNGDPLAGGKVASYLSGTSTPTPTYADATGTPNPNPVVLDSAGRCSIYLNTELTYKFLITDAADVLIDTVDPISPLPTVTPGNVFTVAPGSPAFPGFTFQTDENTGLYGPGADILAVTTGGTERARWGPTGGMNIGGTIDPGDDSLRVEGTLTVQGATALAGPLNVTGLATLSGGVSGSLAVTGATVDTLGVTTLATIATLNVTGNETVGGTLSVTGSETVGGTLQVSGATTVLSTFHVTGQTTLSGGVAGALTVGGTVTAAAGTISGALTVGTTLGVSGQTTLAGLTVTGNETVGGTLGVSGHTTLASLLVSANATMGSASVSGNTLTNTLTVQGAASVGTTLTVGSTLTAAALTVTGHLTANTATINSTFTASGTASVGGLFTCAQSGNFSWQARTPNVVYQAGTDGFVVAEGSNNASAIPSLLIGQTSGTNPPNINVANHGAIAANEWVNIMFPVRRGDFYQVTATGGGFQSPSMWFVPLGTVTS